MEHKTCKNKTTVLPTTSHKNKTTVLPTTSHKNKTSVLPTTSHKNKATVLPTTSHKNKSTVLPTTSHKNKSTVLRTTSHKNKSTVLPTTSHKNKVKNPPEVNTQELDQSVYSRESENTDFTQKLVAMWFGDATGPVNGLLSDKHKVQETSTLQKFQQRCAEAEAYIQDMEHKIENAEKQIDNLRKFLYTEKRSNSELIEKLNRTTDLVTTITDETSDMTDTIGRCQQHKDDLSILYHDIISQQRDEVNKLQNQEDMLEARIFDLQNEFVSMKRHSTDLKISYENKWQEKQAELASVCAQHERSRNELKALVKEKEALALRLSDSESTNFNLKNDCLTYEKKVKGMKMKLVEDSAGLETLKNEKLQTHNDLFSKNLEFGRISNGLESARVQLEEQLAEISLIKSTNHELEEKCVWEAKEQENLTNSIKDSNVINVKLVGQLEKLKEDTSECITELKKRLEDVESEKTQILKMNEEITKKMEKEHEEVIMFHIEKYTTCLAEIKAREDHYQSEISQIDESATTAAAIADGEVSKLVAELNSLREEKERHEQDLRRVENLLMSHKKTELQLKRKLEQYDIDQADLEMIKKY